MYFHKNPVRQLTDKTRQKTGEKRMRTTDTMSFSVKEIIAMGKAKSVGKDEWLHAIAEVYDEPQAQTVVANAALLELLGTVVIPKTEKFAAYDSFVVNTEAAASAKISYLGDNFRSWFLDKTEESSDETTLRYHTLRRASMDESIITELGGEAWAETTLAQIYALIKKQKNGEAGVLLKNGYANIFYVRDVGSVFRAVLVYWDGVGWYVYAFSVGPPCGWFDGSRVFSRNS
ncbi:hypothetical protein KJ885_03455 [Patescibacteria group bacterium]|nr:hypothetical protein [Patescibacteria group bacterium]